MDTWHCHLNADENSIIRSIIDNYNTVHFFYNKVKDLNFTINIRKNFLK